MTTFGEQAPAQRGPFMPAHSSPSQQGPWYYRDTGSVLIGFTTDAEHAASVLPSDLQLLEPAMAVIVIEANRGTTLGACSEVYNGTLCLWQGELYGSVPCVVATGEHSQILGRVVWEFGKKQTHRSELIRHQAEQTVAAMDAKPNGQAARAMIRAARKEPPSAVETLPLIRVRIVPDVERGDLPALAPLVSMLSSANPLTDSDGKPGVYSGPGLLGLDEGKDRRLDLALESTHVRAVRIFVRVLNADAVEDRVDYPGNVAAAGCREVRRNALEFLGNHGLVLIVLLLEDRRHLRAVIRHRHCHPPQRCLGRPQFLEPRVEDGSKPPPSRRGRRDRIAHAVGVLGKLLVENRQQQIVLRSEVVLQIAVGDVELLGDVSEHERLGSTLQKHFLGVVEDDLALCVSLFSHDGP
jgi:acetoacetate decarboxylase